MAILTLDLGTTATKAALWDGVELVSIERAELDTAHPGPDRAEQDPDQWWASVVDACGALRRAHPGQYAAVDKLGFSAARETFVLADANLAPLGPGVLWSDRRGTAAVLHFGDPDEFRTRTGVVLNAACCAAKVAWFSDHEREMFDAARWVLSPRDLVFARLTGEVLTDSTLASRTGFYGLDGRPWVKDELADKLPPVVPAATPIPVTVARPATAAWLEQVGLGTGIDVVIGAGDRACEVLGSGASPSMPMVSWGATTNVSLPHPGPVDALPAVAAVSRGTGDGFLVEAGLSASGAAIEWLARLTGRPTELLLAEAAAITPGAQGLVALPWLNGARAPWWRPDRRGGFSGLTFAHGPGHLARAVVEAVALDVARSMELIAPGAEALTLAGAGAGSGLWRELLAATTGLPGVVRAIHDAGTVGARLLVGTAMGEAVGVDTLNPVADEIEVDSDLGLRMQEVREASDATAAALLALP